MIGETTLELKSFFVPFFNPMTNLIFLEDSKSSSSIKRVNEKGSRVTTISISCEYLFHMSTHYTFIFLHMLYFMLSFPSLFVNRFDITACMLRV